MSAAGIQFQLLAQTSDLRSGRACPLGTGISDVNLFRYCQSIACFPRYLTEWTQPGHYAMSCPDALIGGPKKLRSLLPIARFKRSFRKTLFGELGQGRKTWENQDYA
jgi:hypothetical protein